MILHVIRCLIIAAAVAPIASIYKPCGFSWLTNNPAGAMWTTPDGDGMACLPGLGNAACNTGPNSFCYFSIYPMGYRCCHDVYSNIATDLTANGLEKPRCPLGMKAFNVNSTVNTTVNQIVTCNVTNLQNQGCPINYKCTKASNIPTATTGAAKAPYLCCITTTISSTFNSTGLTPTIIPVAPNSAIDSITYGAAATAKTIFQGDDFSSIKSSFADTDTPTITLATYAPITTKFYHLLIFDATTNKDILLFQTDITGAAVTPATRKIVASGTGATAHNIKPVPVATQASGYQYNNGGGYYSPGALTTPYTSKHTYVVLLFETAAALVAGTPNLAAGGVLDPNAPGTFTTVTAFLKSSSRTPLGTLVAGMYYYDDPPPDYFVFRRNSYDDTALSKVMYL